MIKKKKNQLSFAQLRVNKCLDKTNWLQNVNKLLDWEPIRQKFANLHPPNTGRPAYDLFKKINKQFEQKGLIVKNGTFGLNQDEYSLFYSDARLTII